jgi:hypothetical protein
MAASGCLALLSFLSTFENWQLDGASHRGRAVEYLQALEDVAGAAERTSPHEGGELTKALQRLSELRR